ncbi:MAG: RICIN domain-containing protein [Bauldia sp.]|nr:RICIN domain-containing protein [Bauldia sp.]MCW5717817.1 RICIN domain-containing protein [Bauldia sp.]
MIRTIIRNANLLKRRAVASALAVAVVSTAALAGASAASAQNFQVLNPNLLNGPVLMQAEQGTVREIQGGGLLFLDAHEISDRDFNVVIRQYQNNTTQRWLVTPAGSGLYTIQQVSSGRFLDAHQIPELDFRVVTRPAQTDGTQLWRVTEYGGGFVTIQHVASGLFLQPYIDQAHDFQVVLRPAGNDLQTWRW